MARPTARRHQHAALSPERRRRLTASLLQQAHTAEDKERAALLEEVIVINMVVAETIARRYRDRGIPLEDLTQVACTALVRAVQHYDPSHDRDFLAYAVPSIRGELRRHFRDHGWAVRPPRRLQELRPQVFAARDELRARGREPTAALIAAELDAPDEDVTECLAARGCFQPTSLDQRVGDLDGGASTLGDLLTDDRSTTDRDRVENRILLQPVLRRLSPRDQRLLRLRFEEELTQREIAEDLGVTQTQVSRLLHRVLRDLRRALEEPADDPTPQGDDVRTGLAV